MHSIEFKFCMHITDHRRTNPIDFGEYRVNSFLQEYKKYFYTLRPKEANSLKCSSIQTVHSIKSILKFGMYITGHRRTNPIDFGKYPMNSFFTGAQKRILIHYGLWSKFF